MGTTRQWPPALCSGSSVVTAFLRWPGVRRVTLSGQMAPPTTTTTGMAASLTMGSTPSRRRRTACRSGTDTAAVRAQGTFTVLCVSINSIHCSSCFSEEVAGRQRICIFIFEYYFFLYNEKVFSFHPVHTCMHTHFSSVPISLSHSSSRAGASAAL